MSSMTSTKYCSKEPEFTLGY